MRRTDVTISSPHLGFGIQIKPRGKVSEPSYQRNDIRMTSDKVGNCYHESQQLDGRTRFLSFGFRYENDVRSWMFEQRRVWRQRIFSLELFIIRRTPRHAVSFTHFSSSLIPYINHFHYGNNIKQFSKWKSYCCCWMRNKATLNSTDVFHWSYLHHPIQSSNKHTDAQQGRRLVKASTHFSYRSSSCYI